MERGADTGGDDGIAEETEGAGDGLQQRITFPDLLAANAFHYRLTPDEIGAMSGPQHLLWYETAQRQVGNQKLLDLQVAMPKDDRGWSELRDALTEMSGRGD